MLELTVSSRFFRTPCPAIVEPAEHFDDEDGLSEKLLQKTPKYYK